MNIYGNLVIFLNAADGAAAFANNGPNFVRVNFDGDHARRPLTEFLTGFRDGLIHIFKDRHPAVFCLLQSLTHQFTGEAGYFDIHLQGGNALCRSRDFEVHVAKVVFHALNVTQNGKFFTIGDKTHSHTRDSAFNWDATVHERQAGSANAGLAGTAIGGHHL